MKSIEEVFRAIVKEYDTKTSTLIDLRNKKTLPQERLCKLIEKARIKSNEKFKYVVEERMAEALTSPDTNIRRFAEALKKNEEFYFTVRIDRN